MIKITDHEVPDKGKETLLFSLSVHGNERGGLEGGLRTAEDLAIAAEDGGKIVDGVDNYESSTGREPQFHEYEVRDVLAKEAVYLRRLQRRRLGGRRLVEPAGAVDLHPRQHSRHRPQPPDADARPHQPDPQPARRRAR